jgi:pyruvate/2-oxoglutarate dehydrogenase complex dihydrolipoamide acyltransferase (E2) component
MILAVGGSKEKVVLDEKTGKPVLSTTMVVTLSFDARCVDEDVARRWLDSFERYISAPEQMLL